MFHLITIGAEVPSSVWSLFPLRQGRARRRRGPLFCHTALISSTEERGVNELLGVVLITVCGHVTQHRLVLPIQRGLWQPLDEIWTTSCGPF